MCPDHAQYVTEHRAARISRALEQPRFWDKIKQARLIFAGHDCRGSAPVSRMPLHYTWPRSCIKTALLQALTVMKIFPEGVVYLGFSKSLVLVSHVRALVISILCHEMAYPHLSRRKIYNCAPLTF